MKILATLGLLTAMSVALVFCGGALWAWGFVPVYVTWAVTALGSGWLGIIYSTLLRLLHSTLSGASGGSRPTDSPTP